MRTANHLHQRKCIFGYTDKVDMVGHQAVSKDGQPVYLAPFPEDIKIDFSVAIMQENVFTINALVSYMMSYVGDDYTSGSWHGLMVAQNLIKDGGHLFGRDAEEGVPINYARLAASSLNNSKKIQELETVKRYRS